jgi:hypothetical protein
LAVTDKALARAQWLAQLKVIRASERRIGKALVKAYRGGLDRWIATGSPDIPLDAKRDIVAHLSRMWFDAGIVGGRMAVDQDKAAYHRLETKAEELTLFERIMLEFIQRYGALKVQQIIDTTRDQLQRVIDRGVRDGLGQEGIAKLIIEALPSFSRTRARVIARTETHTAAMYASQEVAKTAAFPLNKRWISTFDQRTRDFGEGDGVADQFNHRAMNEVTVGPDELFSVPSKSGTFELMHGPGDPAGSAGNVINCRCALVYRRVGRAWPKDSDA